MMRIFFFVIALGVLLGLGGLVYVGSYPPNPPQHTVEQTLPNTSFGH